MTQVEQAERERPAPGLGGSWHVREVSYVNPRRDACALCGRPLSRRVWTATTSDGQERAFCEPNHADLFEEYKASSEY